MSVLVMKRVWELDLPTNEKLVLLALADYADHSGFCFPGVARLAWKSGYRIRQTKNILRSLRAKGVLEAIGSSAGGREIRKAYRIHPEKGAKLAPFRTQTVQASPPKGCNAASERMQSSVRKGAKSRTNQQTILIEPSEPPITVSEPSGTPSQKQPSQLHFSGLHLVVTERQDGALAAAFPWVDRAQEYAKADSWLEANPRRRPRKCLQFVHNWFSRISTPTKGGPNRAEQRHIDNLKVAGFSN